MRWATVKTLWTLTRLDTCLLVFTAILLPIYLDSGDFQFALDHALPMLTICMSGFVINDLNDIEKDRDNHPHRPLPSGGITQAGASVIYFILLAASLLAIKLYVEPRDVYLYLLLLLCLVNYNYVVAYAPKAKTFYVAAVGLIPLLIESTIAKNGKSAVTVAPSLFLFLLGREMLMDVQDARADSGTLAIVLGQRPTTRLGFAIKSIGSISLAFSIRSAGDALMIAALVALDICFIALWRFGRYRRAIIHATKLQLVIGIFYVAR
jgi:geranylgeranylglycerol-phosphate geranylgeranyltransferase